MKDALKLLLGAAGVLVIGGLAFVFLNAPPSMKPAADVYGKIDWAAIRENDTARVPEGWSAPKLMPVSTDGWEEGGYISPDGSLFFFGYADGDMFRYINSKNTEIIKTGPSRDANNSCYWYPNNVPCGTFPRYDLFYAERTADGWTQAKPHPLAVQNRLPPKSITLVRNSARAYLVGFPDDKAREDIYYADSANGTWGKLIPVTELNTIYIEDDPYVTPDETEMFFWSDRPASLKGHNIWHSHRINGSWQPPEILPSPINTDGNDMQTFLFGDSLYFASIGRKTEDGTMAVYKSTRQGDNAWPDPEVFVSSKFAVGEPSFSDDGKRFYFEQIFYNWNEKDQHFNPDMMYIERE